MIGKPTLDELGYVSDKHTIELRKLDVRFASTLPAWSKQAAKDTFLRLEDHTQFEIPPDTSQEKFLRLKVAKSRTVDDWWVEAGPDLPDAMQVVEGPLLVEHQRAQIAFSGS